MKNLLIVAFAILTTSVCAQTVSNITVKVEPYMEFEAYEHFNRFILKTSNHNVERINGFSFEWGYRYKLKVKETKLDERLSDGTLYRHELIKVIEKKKVAPETVFPLYMYGNDVEDRVTGAETKEEITLDYLGLTIVVPQKHIETFRNHIIEGRGAWCRFQFDNDGMVKFIGLKKK